MLNFTRSRTTEQADANIPPMPAKDRSFEKKLRWLITNPPAAAERWTITPEMADVMLQWNDRNRPLAQSKVKEYGGLMLAGRWPYTGVPIIFSKERLIDGQHRLAACAESGMCFDALIVFGAPDSAFAYIDVGKTRTAGDIFAINGVPNAALMAAAIGWVIGYDNNSVRTAANSISVLRQGRKIDHAALYDQYAEHPGLQESAWVANLFAQRRLASPSTMLAFHYICARKSRKDADEFFRRVGEGLGFSSKKDPAYRLHKRLVDNAVNQEKLSRIQLAAFTVKAWNAHRVGRDVGILRFNADEAFPKVI